LRLEQSHCVSIVADSSESLGIKWATPAAGGVSYTLLNTGGTALSGSDTTTISSLSGYNNLLIRVLGAQPTSGTFSGYLLINGTPGSYGTNFGGTFGSAGAMRKKYATNLQYFEFAATDSATFGPIQAEILISGTKSTGIKYLSFTGSGNGNTDTANVIMQGLWDEGAAISSIGIWNPASNWTAGTVYVYGSAV